LDLDLQQCCVKKQWRIYGFEPGENVVERGPLLAVGDLH